METDSPVRLRVPTADDMHAVGRDLARLVRPGDLVILLGELGAGKTQLVQGIGEGLGVRPPIVSPSFVIVRNHPSLVGGPELVHVDTYRLTSRDEIEDLDLEAQMPTAVTVVEWGRGFVEQLSDDRLEVAIERSEDPLDDTRLVEVRPVGERWEALLESWEIVVNQAMGRDARADAEGDSVV